MTKDEILNMPAGREMDALIAEMVMGIEPISFDDETKCPECEATMRFCGSRSWCSSCHEWRHSPYKEYSEDISDAWFVFLKFQEVNIAHIGDDYFAAIVDKIKGFTVIVDKSAPLAICRSALLAVMR